MAVGQIWQNMRRSALPSASTIVACLLAAFSMVYAAAAFTDPATDPTQLLLSVLVLLLLLLVAWSEGKNLQVAGGNPLRCAAAGAIAGAATALALAHANGLVTSAWKPAILVSSGAILGAGFLLGLLSHWAKAPSVLPVANGPEVPHAIDPAGALSSSDKASSGKGSCVRPGEKVAAWDGAALAVMLVGNTLLLVLALVGVAWTTDAGLLPLVPGEGLAPTRIVALLIGLLLIHQLGLVWIGLNKHRGASLFAAGSTILVVFPPFVFVSLDGPRHGNTWLMLVLAIVLLAGVGWFVAVRRKERAEVMSSGSALASGHWHRLGTLTPGALTDRLSAILRLYLAGPLFVVLMYGIAVILSLPLVFADQEDLALFEIAWYEAEFLALWIILLFFVRRGRQSWASIGYKSFRLRYLLAVPALLVFDAGARGVASGFLIPASAALSQYQAELDPIIEPSAASIYLLFFGAVFVAPVVEETLFRGYLFTGFTSFMGPRAAAILSAFLFAIFHFIPSFAPLRIDLHPGQAIGAFVSGLIYAGLRHESDSLFPGMIAHATWNLLVIL